MKESKNLLSPAEQETLIHTLYTRFKKYPERHKGITWEALQAKLEAHPAYLYTLSQMETTGGEPDVIKYDKDADRYLFADCAAESPKGRRSLCYDLAAWTARKAHKPAGNAMEEAMVMGVEVMTEEDYKELQRLGEFDQKTSSWLQTPADIRNRGGALFGDLRYGRVFVYHNGADSYYAARGWRGVLWV